MREPGPPDRLLGGRFRVTRPAKRGLAIVKEFTEAGGGRVWVESEPGRGTTFT